MNRKRRGQSTVEYSIISWLLLVGLVLSATVRMVPGPKVPGLPSQGPMSVIELFFLAYQLQFDSYLFSLNAPFP